MKAFNILKRTLILVICILFFGSNYNLIAQTKKTTEKTTPLQNTAAPATNNNSANSAGVISVNFVSGDVAFMYKAFNTVELKATEVDAFVMAQEKLKLIVENPNFQKLTTDVPVKVDMEVVAAEKLIMFANRITLNGNDVNRYKRFLSAIYDAAKALQQQ